MYDLKQQLHTLWKCVIYILFAFQIDGCATMSEQEAQVVEKIQAHRRYKDMSFKKSPISPLPNEYKKQFTGLKYYPVDLRYRFVAKLHKYEHPDSIPMITSTGQERTALKYGYVKFDMHGKPCVLQVYKLVDVQKTHPDYLFLPFIDKTAGKDTYPGGRYLDLKENAREEYVIDFNLAFNPSCAYGKQGYSCPLPPEENRLEVAIRAGEKNYPLPKH